MALITYFKASLPCLRCGRVGTAWIHSHLGDKGATYQIGDDVGHDIDRVHFDDTSYLVRRPSPDEPIHVLLAWTCEHCGSSDFAEVVIAGGKVRDIRTAELTPATLERLNYIAEDVQSMIEEIMESPVYDDLGVRADWLDMLRSALEAGRRWGPSPGLKAP